MTDVRSTPLTPDQARQASSKAATRIGDWLRYQVKQALAPCLDYRKITYDQGRTLGNDLGASLYTASGTELGETADHSASFTIPDPAADPSGLVIPKEFYWRGSRRRQKG
jgi:hypothetical protein